MSVRRRFERAYGARPAHLALALASFALAGWALSHLLDLRERVDALLWLGAAALVHDLVFLPLYSLVGLLAFLAAGGHERARGTALEPGARDALNHVRVPALLSALALLLFFPLILGLDEPGFRAVSGLDTDVYLGRWLLLTAALFAGSALLYAARRRARNRAAADR